MTISFQPSPISYYSTNMQAITAGTNVLISGAGKKIHMLSFKFLSDGLVSLQDSSGQVFTIAANTSGGSGSFEITPGTDLVLVANQDCTVSINCVVAIEDAIKTIGPFIAKVNTVSSETATLFSYDIPSDGIYTLDAKIIGITASGAAFMSGVYFGYATCKNGIITNALFSPVLELSALLPATATRSGNTVNIRVTGKLGEAVAFKAQITITSGSNG